MRYLPKSRADREAMLRAIGVSSIDDLFAPIPSEYRLKRDLHVPREMAESEIIDWFHQRARENGDASEDEVRCPSSRLLFRDICDAGLVSSMEQKIPLRSAPGWRIRFSPEQVSS